ncbi:fumarylacetoacetase [Actinidia rufa]|uniref:Fumarylacetoacetase n=1 Tax=Actinidia rufa TaxID=165716 RepID=A0A7J0DBW6_9ERIC|nr:fumarylacetoacetase [Actinidia rufa]
MDLKSFIEVHPDSHFPIENLPYGVFKPEPGSQARPGVAIGDFVLESLGDRFGRSVRRSAAQGLRLLQSATEAALRDNEGLRKKALLPVDKVEMLLPIAIGDYTDFFSSMHHAKNCGTIFRGPQNAIQPNWFHLPIAYHGRASSIIISGTDIIRPR